MNVNEVLANRASEILGGELGTGEAVLHEGVQVLAVDLARLDERVLRRDRAVGSCFARTPV